MDPGGGGGSSGERNLDFYIINSSYIRTGKIGSYPHSYKLSRTTLGLVGSTQELPVGRQLFKCSGLSEVAKKDERGRGAREEA